MSTVKPLAEGNRRKGGRNDTFQVTDRPPAPKRFATPPTASTSCLSPGAVVKRVARVVREEIVRQYRDDERRKCPAGTAFYEEHISPRLIAQRVVEAMEVENCL
jgi:hypothetical protein